MRFIEHDQIPVDVLYIVSLGLGELIRADDRAGHEQERDLLPLLADCLVAFSFQNQALQAKLVLQLLMPLLAQVRRNHNQHLASPLSPSLGYNQPCLDRLTQTNLVSEDHPA